MKNVAGSCLWAECESSGSDDISRARPLPASLPMKTKIESAYSTYFKARIDTIFDSCHNPVLIVDRLVSKLP